MAQLINGKEIARQARRRIKRSVRELATATGVVPKLVAVLVGEDPASVVYVRNKERACARTGILSETIKLPTSISQADLLGQVRALNAAPDVHGILVQLPLPLHINVERIVAAISPDKDVDGFHPENLGRLFRGHPRFTPGTPSACMDILHGLPEDLAGKHAVVLGRSLIVGKPLAILLLNAHLTVTVCHTHTRDLAAEVRRADVLVAAVGRANLVRGEWVKPGAIVLDVGINQQADGTLAGDVEFAVARERASYITPVPGGVGPITITRLLENVLFAARLHTYGEDSTRSSR